MNKAKLVIKFISIAVIAGIAYILLWDILIGLLGMRYLSHWPGSFIMLILGVALVIYIGYTYSYGEEKIRQLQKQDPMYDYRVKARLAELYKEQGMSDEDIERVVYGKKMVRSMVRTY